MHWLAAKSYFIAYTSIDSFDSIVFFHNYFSTWSLAVLFSLMLPTLYLFAPLALQTSRTPYFLIICLVCLSNLGCIVIQPYLISNSGEPNFSIHTCRFMVFLSTFAKPMGLYLAFLFSSERVFTKFLSKTVFRAEKQRLLFNRGFLLAIFLGVSSICPIRLLEVIRFVKNKPLPPDISNTSGQDSASTDYNSSESILTFQYCYRSMSIGTYGEIISFYILQYWFDFVMFAVIALVLLWMLIHRCYLSRFQQLPVERLSVNTKLYVSLASCVVGVESVLLMIHFIVDDVKYNNSDAQVNYLQAMLFVYNFRCILLPLVICLTLCDPLKQCFKEFFIHQSYSDRVDETDQPTDAAMIDRAETLRSSQ